MAAFNLNQDPPPECFGISWNSKDVLCAGGADLTFRDEKTGSHVRPPCDFFHACGTRVAHTKLEQSRLIPAASLVRAPAQQPAPAASPPVPPTQMTPAQMQQWLNDQAKALATQMLQQMQQYPQGRSPAVPYNATTYPQGGMFFDPRFQPMPVNYQMPAYLTVPEAGGSMFGMLMRTLFRSMGKAVGHSFSHFWDTVPFGGPPPGNGQGG